jgi:hypothetical protein
MKIFIDFSTTCSAVSMILVICLLLVGEPV